MAIEDFSEEYLNTILDDGLTVREHMEQGYKKAKENYKNNSNPKFHRTWEEHELSFEFSQKYSEKIYQLETIIYSDNNFDVSNKDEIEQSIKKCDKSINAYYELKNFCYQFKGGKIYFQDMWEYCHNSNNPCFSYLEQLESIKKSLLDLYYEN